MTFSLGLRQKLTVTAFTPVFKPTRLVDETGRKLSVRVPNGLFRDWLTKHYAGVITKAVAKLRWEGLKIVFITEEETSASRPRTRSPDPLPVQLHKPVSRPRDLNPRYMFDVSMVGSLNKFKHAASLAVAEAPSMFYSSMTSSFWRARREPRPNFFTRLTHSTIPRSRSLLVEIVH
jgi:chromosomal replication initiator protein